MWFTSFRYCQSAVAVDPAMATRRDFAQRNRLQVTDIKFGGEDRNRTYLATCVATTVLKTARATRHPSLSGLRKTLQRPTADRIFATPALLCNAAVRHNDAFDVGELDAAFEG